MEKQSNNFWLRQINNFQRCCYVFEYKSKEKSIIVINIDQDKALWESLCEQYKDLIESIEYKSDKENEQFFFDSTLDNILRGGSLIIDNKTIKTERQFLDYWNNRHKR